MARWTLCSAVRMALVLLLVPLTLTGCGEPKAPDSEAASEPAFRGRIESSIRKSKPDFERPPALPATRPNIVIALADDLGFSDIGSYGSEIETPNLDALAAGGIRYSHFTVTAVCSSTRAALLTGRNHHSVGTGWLAEWDFGFPGYRGEMSHDAITLAEILRQNGYSTYMVGKWHLTNAEHRSRVGPFDSWPTGRGFERYWGFLDGETSQWKPHVLIRGNEIIPTPDDPHFYLPDALTDEAIQMIEDLRAHDADRPFFLYYAPGAPHAPHHTKRKDREKYLGKYARGWDRIREQRLGNQIRIGLAPAQTRLAAHTPGVVPWSALDDDQKKMYARLQENYAGFVDNLDQNVGRLIDHLQAIGEWENTVFIFLSDNGGSAEVGIEGASNALRYFHRRPSTTAQNLEDFDAIGDVTTHPHYPRGWMQASNTPFIHSKRTSHGGGVRVPLIISWPRGIEQHGIRHQFHHITDIMPTLMEILGIALPREREGRVIEPMEGTSMVYSFDDPDAEARKAEQYYEIEGRRAYYDNGWRIISYREPEQEFDDAPWELYDLAEDFSESNDLAAEYAEKIESIEKKWWEAARTYNVLPIIDVPLLERPMYTRHWLERGPGHFEYRPGVSTIQRFKGPILPNHSFTITATIDRGDESQEGVLAALGDSYSGYTLYIKDNRLRFELNLAYEVKKLVSNIEVPIGPVTVQYRFEKVSTALAVAKGLFSEGLDFDRLAVLEGTGSLWIEDQKVAETEIDQPLFAVWEGLDIGRDLLTPVSPEYSSPFTFTGELYGVVYDLD